MTSREILAGLFRQKKKIRGLWCKICEFEGVLPISKFIPFSPDNPFQEEYNRETAKMQSLQREAAEVFEGVKK